jgi:hypothetical protein
MLAVVISLLLMKAGGMHLRVVFFAEGEVLHCLHDISLAKMNHSFDVVDEALVLDLRWVVHR